MADQQLTDLPVAATLTGSEVIYGVQSGDSVQISTNQIKTFTNAAATPPHGTFSSTQTQAIGDIGVAQAITFDTSTDNVGITVASSSRLSVQNTGTFVISVSAIGHESGSSNEKYINIFLKKNGTTVDNSSTIINVVKDRPTVIAVTFVVDATAATDYWELFLAGESTDCEILATPAQVAVPGVKPAQPACPSIVVGMWQVR